MSSANWPLFRLDLNALIRVTTQAQKCHPHPYHEYFEKKMIMWGDRIVYLPDE